MARRSLDGAIETEVRVDFTISLLGGANVSDLMLEDWKVLDIRPMK